jgi:hypothetical protein
MLLQYVLRRALHHDRDFRGLGRCRLGRRRGGLLSRTRWIGHARRHSADCKASQCSNCDPHDFRPSRVRTKGDIILQRGSLAVLAARVEPEPRWPQALATRLRFPECPRRKVVAALTHFRKRSDPNRTSSSLSKIPAVSPLGAACLCGDRAGEGHSALSQRPGAQERLTLIIGSGGYVHVPAPGVAEHGAFWIRQGLQG